MGIKGLVKFSGLVMILIGYGFFCFMTWLLINGSHTPLNFVSIITMLTFLVIFMLITLGYSWRFYKDYFTKIRLVLVILLLIPQFYFFLLMYNNESKSHFSTEGWSNNPDERVYIVDDMLDKYSLKGKTRAEVIKLLGEPTETEYFQGPNILVYYLGPERGFIRIDSEWLIINFDANQKVTTWSIGTD